MSNLSVIFWKESSSERYKGERILPNVDAIIIAKIEDIMGIVLNKSDRVTLDTGDIYTVVDWDNVQGYDSVLEVKLNRYENG